MENTVKENLTCIRNEIEEEIQKQSISREVTLIAVSKTFPQEDIISAYDIGQRVFGESKIQEAENKIPIVNNHSEKFGEKIKWHLIGHLQSNKAKKAVELFDVIHSLDKLSTIKEVDKRSKEAGKIMEILIQVNTTDEDSKSGCQPDEAMKLCENCLEFENIRLSGMMTIGPFGGDDSEIAKSFSSLRELRDKTESKLQIKMPYLSMGMTNDWKIALSEGATHLRIGSAIFGRRSYN